MVSTSIVRNSMAVLNMGKLYTFISFSVCVRARISSTFARKLGERVRSDGRKDPHTNRDRVVDALRFDNIAQEH